MDPVTIITGATVAFNTVKKMIEAGREIEDVASQLGQWFSAVSDFYHLEEQTRNPPLFKKITHSKSVEQEALDLMIQKKKIKEQEKAVDSELDSVANLIRALVRANLLIAGYHPHKGQWRKRRNG